MRSHYLGAALGMTLLALPAHAAIASDAQKGSGRNEAARATVAHIPPAECKAHVGYDRDTMLPGYLLPTSRGPATCIPFTATAAHPPAGYTGKDFYVDEFTDARLRERWVVCKADKECFARVMKPLKSRVPPNREHGITSPHAIYLLGKIKEEGEVDLKTIRRPAFFARAPYREPIAEADARTYIVEFTAPAEPYDRIHRNLQKSIKLRGWYIQGEGIDDGKGGKVRALIIMTGGGGTRLVAIDHPSDRLYRIDPTTGKSVINDFPNETTGSPGQALWRRTIHLLNQAGFDVLNYDRRGVGVSGGFSDLNTLQQGRDVLDVIASLGTGNGLRALTPSGDVRKGREAAGSLIAGASRQTMPILLLGSSRGTMSNGWAMTMNFDKTCSYDMPVIECGPPLGNDNIKGAILLAEYSSGVGYVSSTPSPEDESRGLGRDRGLFIAASEVEHNIVFFPSSAILAGVHKWPAAFFARGLWDYAASLEGTIASYDRVKGLKELVVVRGPHPYETWPAEEQARVGERMVAFARAAALGEASLSGGRPWSNMKELVATTTDVWERSSGPAMPE